MGDGDRKVTIDIETATETATRPEDVARIRREAGLEEGELPSRSEPARGVGGSAGDEADQESSTSDS